MGELKTTWEEAKTLKEEKQEKPTEGNLRDSYLWGWYPSSQLRLPVPFDCW
jgi:hypothetical protein